MYRTFQITREFAQMSVLENLMIMPEYQSGEKIWNTWFRPSRVRNQEQEILGKALEVLEFVELIDLKTEYAGSLSGGQKKLLEIARVGPDVTHVSVSGPSGRYEKSERFPLEDILSDKVFLAYRVNGQTLPKKHGFPLRLVAEGYYGGDWVKYVSKVTAHKS